MRSLDHSRMRVRLAYVLAFVACILLGLASRRYASVFSDLFGKYPGDALWAAMIFFGIGALRRRASTLGNAMLACAICLAIEVLKLYQAPWMVEIRHSTAGHLVFGHVFSLQNLAAYAVGVFAALSMECSWPFAGGGAAPQS